MRNGREAGRGHSLRNNLGKKWKNAEKERERLKLKEGIKRNTGYGSDEYIEQGGMTKRKTKMLKESECKNKNGDRV